jgi:2-dehydro-3-deoxyphosphogluconate aldolase/(4S)-4-hydroxy-2-oxoglutarate aldolase
MTPADQSKALRAICALAPVVPVIVIEDLAHARPLAEALVAGGLPVLEVTLRTPVALAAMAEMAQVPGAVVGAGTVLSRAQARAARDAGARFAVSPGTTPALIAACAEIALPLLPGAATASEVMARREEGFDLLKFFPAEAAGGVDMLRSLGGPLAGMTFCPTGGIGLHNAPAYLALSNVICVGGSWVAPPAALAAGDWAQVTRLAAQAAALQR